jgi:hypothetical protein
MGSFKKIVIVTIAAIVGLFLLLISFIAVRGVLIGFWDVPEKLNWKEKTTPLDPTIVRDLCMAFSLRLDDTRCQPDSIVYAPEFFDVIRETFAPSTGTWATYDKVEGKIGKYQYKLEPPVTQADGTTYFVAKYDLRGDQVFPIGMFFDGNGNLFRIVTDIGN